MSSRIISAERALGGYCRRLRVISLSVLSCGIRPRVRTFFSAGGFLTLSYGFNDARSSGDYRVLLSGSFWPLAASPRRAAMGR